MVGTYYIGTVYTVINKWGYEVSVYRTAIVCLYTQQYNNTTLDKLSINIENNFAQFLYCVYYV